MSLLARSSILALKRRTKGPFRLTTPSTESNTLSLANSEISPTSPALSRRLSIVSSTDTSSTSSDDEIYEPAPFPPPREIPVDDTDALSEQQQQPPRSTASTRGGQFTDQYFPPDHFLAPPTPEQLRRRRKRKPRKSLHTFVKRHVTKREVFMDPKVKKRVIEVDKTNWQRMSSVTVSTKVPGRRDEYVMNPAEFKPVKILGRVYKPTLRRRGRRRQEEIDQGIGIGGYVVQFADGHEYSEFPIDKLNVFIDRYPGLDELIEEFEHISLAREDDDRQAILYFKRQSMLRQESASIALNDTNKEDNKMVI